MFTIQGYSMCTTYTPLFQPVQYTTSKPVLRDQIFNLQKIQDSAQIEK